MSLFACDPSELCGFNRDVSVVVGYTPGFTEEEGGKELYGQLKLGRVNGEWGIFISTLEMLDILDWVLRALVKERVDRYRVIIVGRIISVKYVVFHISLLRGEIVRMERYAESRAMIENFLVPLPDSMGLFTTECLECCKGILIFCR